MGPDISSPVRKDTVAAFSARIRERGEAERSEVKKRGDASTGWGSKRQREHGTFFTIQRIYLRALFARVIPATYKAFLPLSAVKIQREN